MRLAFFDKGRQGLELRMGDGCAVPHRRAVRRACWNASSKPPRPPPEQLGFREGIRQRTGAGELRLTGSEGDEQVSHTPHQGVERRCGDPDALVEPSGRRGTGDPVGATRGDRRVVRSGGA
ncbi:MAG: hypothetical protein ACRDKW_17355, partial [Actinomycetota bacterium]